MTEIKSDNNSFNISKQPEGGFTVSPPPGYDKFSYAPWPMFACTTIEEALKFLKSKLHK